MMINRNDPEKVYLITTEGLIPLANSWYRYTKYLGYEHQFKEFLKDDYTISFLVGFVSCIIDRYKIRDMEIKLGILASSIREAFSHIVNPDELYNLINHKLDSTVKNLAKGSPNEGASGGHLAAVVYLGKVNDGYIYKAGDLATYGDKLPANYFN